MVSISRRDLKQVAVQVMINVARLHHGGFKPARISDAGSSAVFRQRAIVDCFDVLQIQEERLLRHRIQRASFSSKDA